MSIKLTHRVELENGVEVRNEYVVESYTKEMEICGMIFHEKINSTMVVSKPELIELKNLIEEELKK